jgi:hypothetical protein
MRCTILRAASVEAHIVFNAMTTAAPIPFTAIAVVFTWPLAIRNTLPIPAPVSFFAVPFRTWPDTIKDASVPRARLFATINAAGSANTMSTWSAFYTAITTMIIVGRKVLTYPIAIAVAITGAYSVIAVFTIAAAHATTVVVSIRADAASI